MGNTFLKIDTPKKWSDRAKMAGLQLLPKNAVSRAFGAVSDISLPRPIQGAVNHGFALYAGIDLSESEEAPKEYRSLNAFFTRRLREGIHKFELGPKELCSTADGRLSEFGPIQKGTLIQAKGRHFNVREFLDSGREAKIFDGGSFVTVYLSPKDYHRVHVPIAGTIDGVSYIPGHLFPVNPLAVGHIDNLFAVNERLIVYLKTKIGRIAVVMVGATCVGRMSLSFADLKTNQSFRKRLDTDAYNGQTLETCAELGMFNLGSTVVVLIENPKYKFSSDISSGQKTRIGMPFGKV